MKKTSEKFEFLIGAKIVDISTDKYNNLSTVYIETKDKKNLVLDTNLTFCGSAYKPIESYYDGIIEIKDTEA